VWIVLFYFILYEHENELVDIFDLQVEDTRVVHRFLAACASVHVRAAFYMMLDIGCVFPIKRLLLWKRVCASDEKRRQRPFVITLVLLRTRSSRTALFFFWRSMDEHPNALPILKFAAPLRPALSRHI